MLTKGLASNTITGYRSAISEYYDHVDGSPIGSHPDVSKAIQAIFIKNPPPVHANEPIDLTPFLDYIRNLGENEEMTIRNLSIKTAFLLALVTACRPSDIHKIDLSSMTVTDTTYSFDCLLPKEYK